MNSLFKKKRVEAKITCLCPTHGRISRLRKSLSCFLTQDAKNAKLLIYNFHPYPLTLKEDYPNVELINEPFVGDVGEMWCHVMELVDTPFLRPWYDDDIFLPWAVRQGLEEIGSHPAYKTRYFFQMTGMIGKHSLSKTENVGEGSMTFTTKHAKHIGIQESDALWTPRLHVTDVIPSWIFRWSDGVCKSEGISRDYTRKERDIIWRKSNQDIDDCSLYPTDINDYWKAIAAFDERASTMLDDYIDNSDIF